jgi:ACT domain-containing protein
MNATKGLVVPAGGGTPLDMKAPGRFAALKLFGHETNGSVMLFEETVPAGTKSWFHLHRDSDEVAWVLEGEITPRADRVDVEHRRAHRRAVHAALGRGQTFAVDDERDVEARAAHVDVHEIRHAELLPQGTARDGTAAGPGQQRCHRRTDDVPRHRKPAVALHDEEAASDPERAKEVLRGAKYRPTEETALSVTLENRPGALAGVVERLAGAKVNIKSLYATTAGAGTAMVVLTVSNVDKAESAIG